MLLFWYRNQIYAIEARCGPARYSEPRMNNELLQRAVKAWHPSPVPQLPCCAACQPRQATTPAKSTTAATPAPRSARSPAEGAYSEGFANAKFTQDYCIECPSTGSLFSLKDGSVVSWYPNNPVLRMLTPQVGWLRLVLQ